MTSEVGKALASPDDDRRMATLDVILGLQEEKKIIEMQARIQELVNGGVNVAFNTALNAGIQEYLDRHLHLE